MVKNPDYFVAGRPYMDGIRFHVITSAATQNAALISKQVEIFGPDTPRQVMTALRNANKQLVFNEIAASSFQNLLLNTTRPPFDNVKLRQAVSMGINRPAFIHSVYQDGMTQSGIMPPPPDGAWGLPRERLETLPGYGDVGRNLTQAREILASLGYTPEKPFKVKLTSSNIKVVVDAAAWTIDALKQVGIEGEVHQLEPAVFGGVLARREFDIAMNTTGISTDDPDISFFENYGCGSLRNYSGYCNPVAQARFEQQSQMRDHAQRLAHVRDTDALLVTEVARVIYGFRLEYGAHWPHVKNYVHHQSAYNMTRMQEVWLDK
jgi:peptide/nickel transport system substrate-binding protein